MKKVLLQSIGLFGLLLLLSCGQTAPVDVKAEIEQANVEFMAAFDSKDAARLSRVYTEDATLYPPNSENISGRANIEGYWTEIFGMGVTSGKLITDKATSYGDTAVEYGHFEIFADDDMIDIGKFIVIWKKVDGNWKMHSDIWNSSMPLPEPEPEPEEAPSLTDVVDG